MHAMEYYTAMRIKNLQPCTTNLKNMLSGRSQTKKSILYNSIYFIKFKSMQN